VMLMLERLIGHMMKHPGVRFVTIEELVQDFRRRHPR
jgi:peptidoglycan-N-acetylglucosamine deacetylase